MANESSEEQFDIDSLLDKASIAYGEDDTALAEKLYNQALHYLDKSNSPPSHDLITCLQNLAELNYEAQRFTEALPLYQRLLEQSEPLFGPNHLDVIATTFRLAQTYECLKMPRKAEEMFKEATNAAERVLGIAHPVCQKIRDAYFSFQVNQRTEEELELGDDFMAPSSRISNLSNAINQDESELDQTAGQRKSTKKLSNYRPPTKIKSLRYGAESALDQASTILGIRYLWRHWRGAALSIPLFLGFLFFTFFVLSQLHSHTPAVNPGLLAELLVKTKSFNSLDDICGLTFVDTQYVTLSTDVHHRSIPYVILRGVPEDLRTIISSAFTRREYWYQCKKNELIAETGTVLYPKDAPEHFIARKMRSLQEFAESYYRKTGCYPNDAKKWQGASIVYINPFNDKAESPSLKILNGNLDSDYLFHDIETSEYKSDPFEFLRHGGVWREEQIAQPGRINALSLFVSQRCADGFKVTDFYIRGYDREAQPLTAGSPGTFYILGLRNGTNLNQDASGLSAATVMNSLHPPDRICIVESEMADLGAMRQSVGMFLGFAVALSIFAWIFTEFKNRKAQPYRLLQPFEAIFVISSILLICSFIIHNLP